MTFKLSMAVDASMAYMLMFVSMTVTLKKQGYSGSTEATNKRWIISTTKPAVCIKLTTTVGHFYVTLALKTLIWLDYLVFVSCFCSLWPEHITVIEWFQTFYFLAVGRFICPAVLFWGEKTKSSLVDALEDDDCSRHSPLFQISLPPWTAINIEARFLILLLLLVTQADEIG